jgi:23S rRNA pseudouridine1911/1915/1917 synthase
VGDNEFSFAFPGPAGLRLDKYLVDCLPDLSRTRLQGLIRDGFVTINGKVVTKNGALLDLGQVVAVRVPPVEAADIEAEDIPLTIIFENTDLLVINKPAGMVVHPAVGHYSGTLVNAALAHAPDLEGISGEQRPGVVHRLDKETSGLIVMAKNDAAHHWLQDQFRLRLVKKAYLALVDGHPPTPQGRIEAPIGRDPVQRKQMAVVPIDRGREAVTEYQSVERFHQYELLEAHPLTGRTHQIRLHLAMIGCPVVGDTVYGRKSASILPGRFFLHAVRLSITIPGESKPRTFEASLPDELEAVLDQLRHA